MGLRKADPYLVGLPDVFVVIDGRLICIELKRKASHWDQQPELIEWQRRLEKAGARYILAYSLDEVLQGLGIDDELVLSAVRSIDKACEHTNRLVKMRIAVRKTASVV